MTGISLSVGKTDSVGLTVGNSTVTVGSTDIIGFSIPLDVVGAKLSNRVLSNDW